MKRTHGEFLNVSTSNVAWNETYQ